MYVISRHVYQKHTHTHTHTHNVQATLYKYGNGVNLLIELCEKGNNYFSKCFFEYTHALHVIMPCILDIFSPEACSCVLAGLAACHAESYLLKVSSHKLTGFWGIPFGDSPSCWSWLHEGGTYCRGIRHQNPYSLPSCLGPSHGAFEDTHTCLLAAHIHVRMHTPKYDPCIFDVCAGCIHYRGGFVVKAPWRRRKLENYEFSGNSLERVKALLYMRKVGGGGLDPWLSFFCERCILTAKTKC